MFAHDSDWYSVYTLLQLMDVGAAGLVLAMEDSPPWTIVFERFHAMVSRQWRRILNEFILAVMAEDKVVETLERLFPSD